MRGTQGWDRGIAGMCVGEKRKLFIPPEMAYGEKGAGEKIPRLSYMPIRFAVAPQHNNTCFCAAAQPTRPSYSMSN